MLELTLHTFACPLGKVLLLTDAETRVRALDWFDCEARMRRLLDRHYGRAGWSIAPAAERSARPAALNALAAYFEGELQALQALPVATAGTAFQQQVWAALPTIAAGTTCNYGALAEQLGAAAAARAVGLAVGANPISLILPCHRVVGRSGQLTGYAGGLERKRWLLEHEGVLPRLAHGASGRATRI